MNNIERIQKGLQESVYISNPHQCANDKAILAGEFSWIMGQLEQILVTKPKLWNDMRNNFKSDTACERAWEATENGINEQGLRLRAKGVEKMMSALTTLVNQATNESRNLS